MNEIELAIEDLAEDGRGVARVGGKVVFVHGGLPEERVRARIVARRRRHDEAVALEVISPSPARVEPVCRHFGRCGGCALQHLAPAQQIAWKERQLAEILRRIGGVEPESWAPAVTGPWWGYRRKARLSVRFVGKKGRVLVGFREQDGRKVADLDGCPVLDPRIGERIDALAQCIGGLSVAAAVPQVEAALGEGAGALVIRHLAPLSEEDRRRLTAFSEASGLGIFLQPGAADSIQPLGEPPRLSYDLPEEAVRIAFAPLDFIQVNAEVNKAMVRRALEWLDPRPGERVLELFAGLGNFSLPLARAGAFVDAVEGDAGLIERARENARANGLEDSLRFHLADLTEDQGHRAWAKAPYEAMLLDPPRSGAETVFGYLPRGELRRVLYVSCHPGTLARDARILVQRYGFRLRRACAMDMFPHTAHVEAMALFER
ncbi:MAG: 23S rRNA (uracil(1939)-C(5))-methyltransferase RlmD [Lysobacterales bacterium]|jgi:23S rRNA (uracil1939-C5)-methyltransferase|nr:MAG: 23S rRNA (uracil(1939)-C(5))-methyltransferase RlmD [Xanthomonadales bacterium]